VYHSCVPVDAVLAGVPDAAFFRRTFDERVELTGGTPADVA